MELSAQNNTVRLSDGTTLTLTNAAKQILDQLVALNKVPDQWHYWLMAMNDGKQVRFVRAPAEDPGQAEMAQKVADGTYGRYAAASVGARDESLFGITYSDTQDEVEGQYASGYYYKSDQYDQAAAHIIQFLEDGKMPPAPQ